jgi:hypothetical protein
MKLIEALVMVQQEYGIYGDWQAVHPEAVITLWDGQYTSRLMGKLVGQSERLETVIAKLAEAEASSILDDRWKIQRAERNFERHNTPVSDT